VNKLAAVLCLCVLAIGCGGGNSSSNSNPLAPISNGATLATGTSYWACETCVPGFLLHLQFATDGSFETIITGNGPGSTTCTGTVTYPPNQPKGTEFILGGSCTGGTDDIQTMTGIQGTTASGGFTATTTTVSMNQDSTYNGCSFTLVQGQP
jgi:hypothetical protein